MRITTNDFISADFFIKGETVTLNDSIPHVMPSQVHGKKILVVDSETLPEFSLPSRPEADGIFLTVRNVQASLRFADCAPVMLWSNQWVMILHSGYKGTVLNISREGLNLTDKNFSEINAWIGPCIGREYFRKIGDEWTTKGIESFHRENFDINGENVYFDLAGEIQSQLIDCGVDKKRIVLSGIDTLRDKRCCSYRRGDVHERMTLAVRLL